MGSTVALLLLLSSHSTDLLDRDVKQEGATDGCLVRCQGGLFFPGTDSSKLIAIPIFFVSHPLLSRFTSPSFRCGQQTSLGP